jgi:hypothetical protein
MPEYKQMPYIEFRSKERPCAIELDSNIVMENSLFHDDIATWLSDKRYALLYNSRDYYAIEFADISDTTLFKLTWL